MVPGAPSVLDTVVPVLSARVAGERNRILGRGLAEAEDRAHADTAQRAEVGKLEAREQFKASSPVNMGAQSTNLVDTTRMLSWKGVDGAKTVKTLLVEKGYQDPDLHTGNVDIAGCVSRKSSHWQLISLGALKGCPL